MSDTLCYGCPCSSGLPILHWWQSHRYDIQSFVGGAKLLLQQLQFIFNVQHDCERGKCQTAIIDSTVTQEHESITRRMPVLQHSDDLYFVINTHALHNAHLLRQILPRSLVAPAHTQADRTAFHAQLVPHVRATRTKKRDGVATKRAARAAAARGEGADGEEGQEDVDEDEEQ